MLINTDIKITAAQIASKPTIRDDNGHVTRGRVAVAYLKAHTNPAKSKRSYQ
jgi:hypothetical protein